MDILVSWNFRHIVRYDKIRQFNAVNLEQGYHTLDIYIHHGRWQVMEKIDAVEMVRKIRDKQHEDITGKSPQEIIDYFQRKAVEVAQKVGALESPRR